MANSAALLHPQTIEGKLSDRQIAEHVGVNNATVSKYRRLLESTVEIQQLTERTGKDGKTRRLPEKKRAGDVQVWHFPGNVNSHRPTAGNSVICRAWKCKPQSECPWPKTEPATSTRAGDRPAS